LNNKGADKNECLYGGDSGIITPIMQVATPATSHLLTINTDAKKLEPSESEAFLCKHARADIQTAVKHMSKSKE